MTKIVVTDKQTSFKFEDVPACGFFAQYGQWYIRIKPICVDGVWYKATRISDGDFYRFDDGEVIERIATTVTID